MKQSGIVAGLRTDQVDTVEAPLPSEIISSITAH